MSQTDACLSCSPAKQLKYNFNLRLVWLQIQLRHWNIKKTQKHIQISIHT